MTPSSPDYYAILGLDAKATPDAIKKRYRELARRYHPDVNPSPDAAQKIKAINQAYHVLGDPDRRGNYDAERALRQPSKSAPHSPAPGASPRSRPYTPPSSQPSSNPDWEFDGFGRKHRPASTAYGANASGSTTRNSATAKAREEAAQAHARQAKKAEIDARIRTLMTAAMTAFDTRNYAEAESLCRKVLALDYSVAVAHEMLGDLYERRGQREDASISFSYAIQFNPRNYSAQGKLDRLTGRRPPTNVRQSVHRAHSAGWRTTGAMLSREMSMGLISIVLFVAFCGLLALYPTNPGVPIDNDLPWMTAMSPNLLLTLVCEGTIAGVLLAFYGRQRPLSQELEQKEIAEGTPRRPIALLVPLTLLAIVWYYLSLLVYIGVAASRNRFSVSILRIYGLVFALSGLFAFMASQVSKGGGSLVTAAFSGNLLFPAALFGWYLGDRVRLRGK